MEIIILLMVLAVGVWVVVAGHISLLQNPTPMALGGLAIWKT